MKRNTCIKLGHHRLFYGDATNSESYKHLFENDKCNLFLVDPPYNVNYSGSKKKRRKLLNDNLQSRYKQFVTALLENSFYYMQQGSSYYIFVAGKEMGTYKDILGNLDAHQSLDLVWVKNHFVLSFADYKAKHEHILYGWKKGAAHNFYGANNQTTVLEFRKPSKNKYHPTQKPSDLIRMLILNSTQEKEIIFDACLGSGTTLLEAQKTNRICYGMEMDIEYVKTIINRFKFHYPNEKIEIMEAFR